jgi:hypothetical protein
VSDSQIVNEVKQYRYQPTDESGRPIGGEQVIKYTTHEELAEKLRDQSILLIRKLRQETKKNRLGILEDETLPEDVQHFDAPASFNPRELSEEERYDIARKLIDPTTATEAAQALVESQIGAPLSSIGERFNRLEKDNVALKAQLEAEAFARETPDYYMCDENAQTLIAWIIRYQLAPTKANFKLAFNTLKDQDSFILGPAPVQKVEPIVETPVVQEPEPVIREQLPEPVIPAVLPATGLTRENSSSDGPSPQVGNEIIYEYIKSGQHIKLSGLEAVRAMPGEEYKRRLLGDRNFGKIVDKLESEAQASRRRG